jgi:hypothetical protein
MPQLINPQIVEKAHLQARSWRKVASELNDLYGVSLSHTAWRDYAIGKHDIADSETRAHLMLPPRACPSCGHKHAQRKPTKSKRIRTYVNQPEKVNTFIKEIELRDAPR